MRPSLLLATVATSVAAALIGPMAIAHADETPQQTISRLESQGYSVNVDRVGSNRTDDCLVTSVRNPQTQTRSVRDYYGRRDENGNRRSRIIQVVTGRTISVSLDCT